MRRCSSACTIGLTSWSWTPSCLRVDRILATRRILRANPDQLVVVLTGSGDDELGLLALRAGAVGFLSKHADVDALLRA